MRRRTFLRATAAAATAATAGLAGCGYRAGLGDPRWTHTVRGSVTGVRTRPGGGAPVVVSERGDHILARSFGDLGHIVSLDPATGALHWRFGLGAELTALGPRYPTPDRPVHVGLANGEVGRLHPRAEPAPSPTPGTTPGAESTDDDSGDGWSDTRYVRAERLAALDGPVMVVASDGRLVYALVEEMLVAVGPGGAVRWRRPMPTVGPQEDEPDLVPLRAGVLVRHEHTIRSLDRAGETRWRVTDTAAGRPVARPVPVGEAFYVTCEAGLAALAPDGTERWHADLGGGQFDAPAVAGDTVYVAAFGGLDAVARDGTTRWRYRPAGADARGPPVAVPGRAFVRHRDDTVAAVADGTALWRAPLPEAGDGTGGRVDGPFRVAGRSLVTTTEEGVTALWRPQTDPDPLPYV
jgi:outer membrane protein assembly factor BamB